MSYPQTIRSRWGAAGGSCAALLRVKSGWRHHFCICVTTKRLLSRFERKIHDFSGPCLLLFRFPCIIFMLFPYKSVFNHILFPFLISHAPKLTILNRCKTCLPRNFFLLFITDYIIQIMAFSAALLLRFAVRMKKASLSLADTAQCCRTGVVSDTRLESGVQWGCGGGAAPNLQ
jgi:hypothetical protein